MKHAKKLFSVLLAMVMVLSLATVAFAATGSGSITINNATVGETYSIYKVFDLTYVDDAVSYSYTKTGGSDELFNALNGEDSPFTLIASAADPNVYNVSLKSSKTADDISSFLKSNESKLTLTAGPTEAENTTLTFSNLEYGYYYVTSSLGATVTIDNVKPDVTVIDKNQTPGWEPEDPTNPDGSGETGKFVANSEDGAFDKSSTAEIKDTAFFKINAFAPKYAGDKLVATYIFEDTLGDGFTYNNDLQVKLNGNALTKDSDYTITVENQTITVIVNAGTISDYPADAHLSITYSAQVDADAVYDNVNTVDMSWTVYPNNEDDEPQTSEPPYDPNGPESSKDPSDPDNPPTTTTNTYVFGFNLQKYKNEVKDENKLDGAKFKLYDAATDGNEIKVVKISEGNYRVASAEEIAQDGFVGDEIEAGSAKIFGLDAKSYYLEETVAPAGYNLLDERVQVDISNDAGSHTEGIMNAVTNVINLSGTLLPSTGGMGTTLFYVLGGVLVAGAVVLLVTKKRMSKAD